MSKGLATSHHILDVGAFYDLLDRKRVEEEMSWRRVAQELGVAGTLFTRLQGGATPSVDTLVSCLFWADRARLADLTCERPR